MCNVIQYLINTIIFTALVHVLCVKLQQKNVHMYVCETAVFQPYMYRNYKITIK